jgi:hypothetical protein
MCAVVILSVLGLRALASAGDAQVADLLFGKVKEQLSSSDQAAIVRQLGFAVGEDGTTLLDPVCGLPVSFETTVEDLNRDGIPEIFVVGGNSCLSGATGSSVSLFIRDESGHYQAHLGFPAAVYEVLDSMNDGFPDLKFGGRGFCRGVWRWNGKDYEHLRNEPDEPGGCDYIDKSFHDRGHLISELSSLGQRRTS